MRCYRDEFSHISFLRSNLFSFLLSLDCVANQTSQPTSLCQHTTPRPQKNCHPSLPPSLPPSPQRQLMSPPRNHLSGQHRRQQQYRRRYQLWNLPWNPPWNLPWNLSWNLPWNLPWNQRLWKLCESIDGMLYRMLPVTTP